MNVLVAGIGRMGSRHVRVLRVLGHDPITVDPFVDDAMYGDIDDVIDRIDAACVAVPISHLADTAIRVIDRFAPRVMLVEKPGGATAADLSRLADAATRADVRVMIGYTERSNPAVRMLANRILNGSVPHIAHVVATRFSPDAALVPDVPHEIDLAVHDIDLAWRYAHGATFAWMGGHAPVRSRMFTCVHDDGTATVLDLDNRLVNGVQVRGDEPLARQWRQVLSSDSGYVPLTPEIDVLETAERMTARDVAVPA